MKSILHSHKNHEEIYIFIKGNGQFQVDGNRFNIMEGSVIRIAPDGRRTWRNNSDKPLIFMVIQAKNDSLDKYFVEDSFRVREDIKWDM
ncbi:MAG: cupin domain-containing protein [Bacteroidales bacterium]